MTFKEMLRRRNVPFAEFPDRRCRDGWINLECCFCRRGPGEYRLGYNLKGGYCNCWTCGYHSIPSVVQVLYNVTWKDAHLLAKEIDPGTRLRDDDEREGDAAQTRGTLVLPPGVGPLMPAHTRYIKDRGLSPEELEKVWGVRGIGPVSLPVYVWSLFIPIHHRKKVVSWTTRRLFTKVGGGGLRYRSAGANQEELPHKDLLFGEDFVRHAVVVCEGPFDVFRIGPGAVATFGTTFSRAQVRRLSKYPVRVVCFDNEPEAQARADKLVNQLLPFPGQTLNVVLAEKDAAEAREEDIQYLRRRFLA